MQLPANSAADQQIAFELRESWQGRVLAEAKGQLGAVVLSMLAHNFDEAMPTLLRVVFPGFESISAPFYCSAAKVNKAGCVVADVVTRDGSIVKNAVVFNTELQMQATLRSFADHLKLSDADRVEFFKCAQRWVVADQRLDPNFDPKDPDAKRLTQH